MSEITEDYVSFETAKLLKEKGFDEPCYMAYVPTNRKHMMRNDAGHSNSMHPDDYYAVPTLQMAMKWLREVHKLSVRTRYDEVEDEKEHLYYVWFFDILSMNPYKTLVEPVQGYSTYEEACESAIKYCLKKLI